MEIAVNIGFKEALRRISRCKAGEELELDLSGLYLDRVPPETVELGQLITLNISDNRLQEIPEFICSLSELRYLDLNHNAIARIPRKFNNLVSLLTLNLSFNRLSEIPGDIDFPRELKHLNLNHNSLDLFPEGIGKLEKLQRLDLRWNNLSSLPRLSLVLPRLRIEALGNPLEEEIDADVEAPKKKSLLAHLEIIANLSSRHGIDRRFAGEAKTSLCFVAQKLSLNTIQAALFSQILKKYDEDYVSINDIAKALECTSIQMLDYIEEFESLEERGFIKIRTGNSDYFSQRRRHGRSRNLNYQFRVPPEVIESLRLSENYTPAATANLKADEFLDEVQDLYAQRYADELNYDNLQKKLLALMDNNSDLEFVKKLRTYNLDADDMTLFVFFCTLFIFNSDDNIRVDDFEDLYSYKSQMRNVKRELFEGWSILFEYKLIENPMDDGFPNQEAFKLTDTAKSALLAEFSVGKKRQNKRDIIAYGSLADKKLFYNDRESLQVTELSGLLQEANFASIQERLKMQGMRAGFACLFYGPPGTGKTETVYQMARATGRDIMMVDIAATKSKWFGESEKLIKDIFDRYRNLVLDSEIAPILLFNEADAIIGKRKEVSQSAVAQTENTIQNIILQEIENLTGILIATTNLTQNLDHAFERRFLYKIEFSKPSTKTRLSIWQAILPGLSDEDAGDFSARYDFSGGQIENIARRCTVDSILSGNSLNPDRLEKYCREEQLGNQDGASKIGF